MPVNSAMELKGLVSRPSPAATLLLSTNQSMSLIVSVRSCGLVQATGVPLSQIRNLTVSVPVKPAAGL